MKADRIAFISWRSGKAIGRRRGLFDLAADPGEARNVADANPAVVPTVARHKGGKWQHPQNCEKVLWTKAHY